MGYQICSRCVFDESVGNIEFLENGICSYCEMVRTLLHKYGTGTQKGENFFQKIKESIQQAGRGRPYDCVVGVSGGVDSSYLLLKAKEWGLRPLAVHYDNTWNSAVASMNIAKITESLDVDLITVVANNKEIDDIKMSFLKAGVPEFDADTDIALVQVLRKTAARFGIKYILEGHSFVAEGISPPTVNYFDGKYIADVHKKHGTIPLKHYPNLTLYQFLKWSIIYRQKFIRPFWYLKYSREEAKQRLLDETDWQDYGGHHLENLSTAFLHKIWLPYRFKVDLRNLLVAADVRSGLKNRQQGLEELKIKPSWETDYVELVQKRLKLDEREFQHYMDQPLRFSNSYKTYKKTFEILQPLFWLLTKLELVPMSFYLKYCKK